MPEMHPLTITCHQIPLAQWGYGARLKEPKHNRIWASACELQLRRTSSGIDHGGAHQQPTKQIGRKHTNDRDGDEHRKTIPVDAKHINQLFRRIKISQQQPKYEGEHGDIRVDHRSSEGELRDRRLA